MVVHAVLARSASPAASEYVTFLIPGFALMVALQNAFANSSSSLMQSKLAGNLVFLLVAPLSPWEILAAFSVASALRGVLVAAIVTAAVRVFLPFPMVHPAAVLAFALVGGALLGALGVLAAVRARKFDELAAFQNLVVVPITFLSGVFYSVDGLPPLWRTASRTTRCITSSTAVGTASSVTPSARPGCRSPSARSPRSPCRCSPPAPSRATHASAPERGPRSPP